MRGSFIAALATFALAIPAVSDAEMLSFGCITNTSAQDCAIGASQLSLEVVAAAGGQVEFIFRNAGPADSSVTAVYFDDGTLLDIASIVNGSGVSFSEGATPPNLPGANNASPPFQVTAGFLADSDSPTQPNGVNPSEVLSIFFTLQAGRTVNDVFADLRTGALRAGIKVQGYDGGGSESFVNLAPVPLPAAGALLLAGLGGLFAAQRRRRAGI